MKPNVQLAASVEFLKTDILGALQSVDDKQIFMVKQLNGGKKPTGISLKELASTLTKSVGAEEISLPAELESIAQEYRIFMNQVYLKIERSSKNPEKKADFEYALWLSIAVDEDGLKKLKEENPIFELLAIKEVALKIWNSSDAKILEEMNFVDIKDQLSLNAA